MAIDLNRLRRDWAVAVLIALSVGGALAAQAVYRAPADPSKRHVVWLVVAIALGIAAAVLPLVDARLRQRRRQAHEARLAEAVANARADAVMAMNDALDPLVEALGQVLTVARRERPQFVGKLIAQALNSAAQVIGRDRTRVNFFEVRGSKPNRQLVCDHNSAGRAGLPATVFAEGDTDGDFMFSLLADDRSYFCADVEDRPPPGWDPDRKRGYRTFISVPSRAGRNSVGFVTADAVSPGDLEEQDKPLLRVIGTVIAAGVLLTERGE